MGTGFNGTGDRCGLCGGEPGKVEACFCKGQPRTGVAAAAAPVEVDLRDTPAPEGAALIPFGSALVAEFDDGAVAEITGPELGSPHYRATLKYRDPNGPDRTFVIPCSDDATVNAAVESIARYGPPGPKGERPLTVPVEVWLQDWDGTQERMNADGDVILEPVREGAMTRDQLQGLVNDQPFSTDTLRRLLERVDPLARATRFCDRASLARAPHSYEHKGRRIEEGDVVFVADEGQYRTIVSFRGARVDTRDPIDDFTGRN